ncbi:MAG TPA: acyl-CoA dehydrogenase family protein [Acidimicrobiales bacterium]|jgi:alkylation response protein AidB-like acyl-CoA dehydrogenase|nr:acyl-CoA dehydrogenase family protein [Acidimicrobiales bacterium]
MDAAERALFADTVRQLTEQHTGDELDAALEGLGWSEALAVDRPTAVSVLFEAIGEANATSSALDVVLCSALTLPANHAVAVALPPLRTCDAPGRDDASVVTVNGLGTRALSRHDNVVVVAASGQSGHTGLVVPTSALNLDRAHGLDPDLGLIEVTGSVERSSVVRDSAVDWGVALATGQLALGHELVGAARTMLELARVHALERMQFGRPIASFQAVRHRLAESLVAVEAATALLNATWDQPDPVGAAMAKALAGHSARTVARHCQQILAGIGFTTEHAFHTYLRRVVVLDQLLGAGVELTRRLGGEALATASLPGSFPL